jgi:DNA-binding SARP family transcriptional activator
MYVTVLGPVRARSGEESIAVSSNQRLLIAMLAARAGRVVSADLLIDTLWGGELPNNPAAALQNLVSRIRARLCPDDGHLLVTDPPGYRLMLDDTSLDRIVFERTVSAATEEPDDTAAISIYDTALGLWNGAPYAEFDDVPALREDRVRLQELCEHAHEQRLERLVRLDPATAVGELQARVDASRYRECGHALLIDALDRTGRPRDALRAYARYRDIMVNELGLDPSPALQRLEHEILIGNRPARPPVEAGREPLRRHNLTSRRTSFVGRDAVIRTITQLAKWEGSLRFRDDWTLTEKSCEPDSMTGHASHLDG